MKLFVSSLVLLVCFTLKAQQNSVHNNVSINHSISDDGKKLDIKVKGSVDGKPVDYNHSFDVTGMDKEQRDAIKRRIYDSLGLSDPIAPIAPMEPMPLMPPMQPMTAITGPDPSPHITSKDQYNEFETVGGKHPYTKEIRYNTKTGLLFMKFRFQKDGKSVTNEKSVDAKDKSKEERDQIIKAYEKEIGFREQGTA